MKKTYIVPETQITLLQPYKMVAESLSINGSKSASGTSGGWAKEDNGWDDEDY